MLCSRVLLFLRHLVLAFLCFAFVIVTPCVSSLLCLNGNRGMLSDPVRHFLSENETTSGTMVAASKAYLSSVVFHGTLLSVLVQRDGTIQAAFGVNQVLKVDGSAMGEVEVVYFQRQRTGEECVFDVNEENLRLGTQYVVFGRPLAGSLSSVTATAFPIPYEKRTFRAIRKVVCKGCAKPPSVEGLKNVRIVERRKLRLQCHLAGNPIPWVEWYKDGQKLDGKGRIRVRTKRRTSRLIIRQSRRQDRGVYECRASNVVQQMPTSAKAIVTVTKQTTTKKPKPQTTTSTASSLWPTEPCPNSDFCLNGGTCVFYRDVREYVCHCAEGYVGLRCDYKDVRVSVGEVRNYKSRGAIP